MGVKAKKQFNVLFLVCLALLVFQIEGQRRRNATFMFLNLSDPQIRSQLLKSYEINQLGNLPQNDYNQTESEKQEQMDQQQLNQKLTIFRRTLNRVNFNRSVTDLQFALTMRVIASNENLTSLFFKNLEQNSLQLRVFRHLTTYQVRKQFLIIFGLNTSIIEALRTQTFLRDNNKRKGFLEHFFSHRDEEITKVILRNVNLQFYRNQRCVLGRVPQLRKLRDQGKFQLTNKQKQELIPIILKSNSLWQSILHDEQINRAN